MTFRTSLNNPEEIFLLYEVVSPNKNLSGSKVNLFVNQLSKFLSKTKVDGLFIPEIVPETRRSSFPTKEKVEPRILAKKIWQKLKMEIIISRVVVHLPVKKQKKWFLETFKNYGIKNFVLVGGEKEAKFYPGPSVSQAVQLIKPIEPNKICCGGITIPTRRAAKSEKVANLQGYKPPRFDEVERIISKQKAGIEFFISQIIFEKDSTIKLLKDYYQTCQKQNIKPARIFLSFTPISQSKDIKFLESLGVFIPKKNKNQMGEKSIKLAKKIFKQILDFTQKQKIKVPLGINISYLTKHNFTISQKMVKCFKQ